MASDQNDTRASCDGEVAGRRVYWLRGEDTVRGLGRDEEGSNEGMMSAGRVESGVAMRKRRKGKR